ncbi:hypothetical protein ACSBR1_021865 [Camellia fascicularis]
MSKQFTFHVRGVLKDKTILLVTHQVDFLHNIDLILAMRDGVIVQSGKYNDILQSGVDFQALVSAHETSMELVSELLGISSELLSLKYCSGPSPVVADADIKPEVHRLIHDLVLHIHKNDCYYSGDDKSTTLTGRKEMVFLANLCAFQFWHRVYKDKLRLDRLKQLLHFDEMKAAQVLSLKKNDEDILNSVHRFQPKFLATADGLPLYYEPYEFQYTCLLTCQQNGSTDTMAADDEHSELPNETRKCNSVPFVPCSYFLSHEVAENLATIIKEVRVQYTEDISGNEHKYVNGDGPPAPWEPSLCKFFVKELCNRGNHAHFLIHFKQKDLSASSSFLSSCIMHEMVVFS